MFALMRSISKMSTFWRIWIALLVLVNLFVPLAFVQHPEAQLTILAMIAGFLTQAHIHSKLGFVRLLGLGHIFWIPLIAWLVSTASTIDFQTAFGVWLAALIVINTISLMIDFVEVIRFVLGERLPTVTA